MTRKKYCGTAAQAGGNGENKPRPQVMGVPCLLENMPKGTLRGKGPSALTQIVEITSGRAIFQQGLTTTCKDSPTKASTVGGERILVWRMSPYER